MKIFYLGLILGACIGISSVSAQPSLPTANGAYGGIDALGRVLSVNDTVNDKRIPAPRKERLVGLFYFLWLAQHGNSGPYDITKIVTEHPDAINDSNHPAWGPLHVYHHWGESIFGYYTSNDNWVKRKHVQMLTDAGVDFLILDATNAVTYLEQVLPLLSILDEYRKQGWNVPKIVCYTNSNSAETIQKIYEGLYKKNLFPELWFRWEGKPLIIGHPENCSEEIRNFFRIKKSQWPNENKYHDDGFPWIAFERPQHVFKNAQGENEIINVSVAQHNGTIRFSSSAFYGDTTNWTRSFHNGKNDPTKDAFKFGYNFAEQFNFAIEQDPKIIFVTGWNEWIAMRFNNIGPKNEPVQFVDLCDTNNSRDIEPMQGGFGDNYYLQLIEFIRQYKGDVSLQNALPNTINIQGDFGQWENVKTLYHDYIGDIVDRDVPGYGTIHYTNKTGRNDFDRMKVAADEENIYFHVQTVKPITPPDGKHWMSLFLRIGNTSDEKNWEGYHFVVNRIAPVGNSAILEKSIGAWNWTEVAKIPIKFEGNQLHLAVPKKYLAAYLVPSDSIRIEFKWADNYQEEGNINSFYLDGDAAPLGRLNYIFRTGTFPKN